MRLLVAAAFLGLAPPSSAATVTYPVSVPPECVELAQREHVPVVIENRYQALRAEYKLARLSNSDPMVAQCKEAVKRLKASAKS
ncbi:MAG: hypothetical protein NVSMB6_24390 [Burkholderiaceae bacterium]